VSERRRRLFLGILGVVFAGTCSIGLTRPFLRHQEAVVARYGSYARNFARMGVWESRFGMIQVNAPDMSVFGDWRDHYYPQRPALSAILLSFWTRIFGDGEASLRASLILVGWASILLFHALARRLLPEPWDLIATVLFALNPMFLYYSLIAVHYVYALLFSLAAWAAAVRVKEGRKHVVLMFTSIVLGCFTDWPPYFTALSLILYFWKERRALSVSIGAVAVACFGLNLLHRWSLDPRSVGKLFAVGAHHVALGGVSPFAYLYSEAREIGLYYTLGLTVASILGTVALVRRRERTVLLFALFGLEEVLFFRQAYEHDYLTISLAPFMALSAAVGLRHLWERPKLKLVAAGLAGIAFLQAVVVNGDRLTRMGGNEPAWRSAVLIREQTGPRERSLLAMENPMIEYYADRYASRIDTIAKKLSLSPKGPVKIDRIEDLVAHLERGDAGFDVIVVGAAERATANIDFFRKVGLVSSEFEKWGFFTADHPLRRLLSKQARREESHGAFQLYRMK
jgi:predicted membrane-bound mannosyltransferase